MSFNNFHSTIGNQVIGTLNISGSPSPDISRLHQEIIALQKIVHKSEDQFNNNFVKVNAQLSVLREELLKPNPEKSVIKNSLDMLGEFSVLISAVKKIGDLVENIF